MTQERDSRGPTGPPSPFDDDSVPFYTIGQVAQILGIQPAALRRLDEQNIVRPGGRSVVSAATAGTRSSGSARSCGSPTKASPCRAYAK